MPGKMTPDGRMLLAAVTIGLFVGVSAAFGWAKVTPAAEGFFAFCAAIIGARMRR